MGEVHSAVAFKEWAVVCAALASGRQTIILRKGGIHEGKQGFHVDHTGFWLFPTAFHQDPALLIPEAATLLGETLAAKPPDGIIRIRHFVSVDEVIHLQTEEQALRLAGNHIWSEATVKQRFAYREPGLFVLVVRVFESPETVDLPDSAYFAGCRSWVGLSQALPTTELRPVLTDEELHRRADVVRRAVGG